MPISSGEPNGVGKGRAVKISNGQAIDFNSIGTDHYGLTLIQSTIDDDVIGAAIDMGVGFGNRWQGRICPRLNDVWACASDVELYSC